MTRDNAAHRTRFATEAGRLEAFSDGVLAVIITIMVLELRPPFEPTFASLRSDAPTFLAYALSFVFIGIYWNNHHHMLRASSGIDGRAMWANLHLLFWLSLVPFTTAWLGEIHRERSHGVVRSGLVAAPWRTSFAGGNALDQWSRTVFAKAI